MNWLTMIPELSWPWLLLALPLPLIWQKWVQVPLPALPAVYFPQISHAPLVGGRKSWRLWIVWALLVVAACRPVWIGEPLAQQVSGRDLQLAVDISGSMDETDFLLNGRGLISRLQAVKVVASKFIRARKGDRVGLILFGNHALVQTPLTYDLHTVERLLLESDVGLAGRATAIGDAIGLAVKRLQETDNPSRVIVLLTDGSNTAGELDPIEAAELAAQLKIRIHTIGIGAQSSGFLSLRNSDLDEGTLREISRISHGQYYRATDAFELQAIYDALDELEPVLAQGQALRKQTELFWAPLLLAMILWGMPSWPFWTPRNKGAK